MALATILVAAAGQAAEPTAASATGPTSVIGNERDYTRTPDQIRRSKAPGQPATQRDNHPHPDAASSARTTNPVTPHPAYTGPSFDVSPLRPQAFGLPPSPAEFEARQHSNDKSRQKPAVSPAKP